MATLDPLGLTIFLIGIALLVLELANPGYFVGVAGTAFLAVGFIQMVWPGFIFGSWWSPFLVAAIALAALLVSIEFYRRFAPAVGTPETLSSDSLIGKTGKSVAQINPDNLQGKVRIGGIVWSATAARTIESGTEVVVTKVDGVHLVVEPTIATAPPAAQETSAQGETHG